MTRKHPGVFFRSTRANENLGQIKSILADRAGTITKDKLIITSCQIGDNLYYRTLNHLNDRTPETCTPKYLFPACEFTIISSREISPFFSLKYDLGRNELIKSDLYLYHFLMCMTTCNQVYPKSMGKSIHVSVDDKIMMETSKELGISDFKRQRFMHHRLNWKHQRIFIYRF